MYSTTAESYHYQRRVGSYSTRGTGRGTVWWNVPLPKESHHTFKPIPREIKSAIAAAREDFRQIVLKRDLCLNWGDKEGARECHQLMRPLKRHFRRFVSAGFADKLTERVYADIHD